MAKLDEFVLDIPWPSKFEICCHSVSRRWDELSVSSHEGIPR